MSEKRITPMGRMPAWLEKFTLLRRIIYFFPVRLLLVQMRNNLVLVLFWAILFAFVSGGMGARYGVELLFTSPEYLGHVDFLSFFLVGFACGGFIMAYQISCYIHNSYRFPFLATLTHPFARFCLNNFFIPGIFQLFYVIRITRLLAGEQYAHIEIVLDVLGFVCGNAAFVFGTTWYLMRTGKDLIAIYGKTHEPSRMKRVIYNRDPFNKMLKGKAVTPGRESYDWHVETYLASPFKIRLARPFEHYDKELLKAVFRQNHTKAVVFEIGVMATLLILGFFRDVPFMMIPAGASIFLLFTLYLMLTGVLSTWVRGWSNVIVLLILLALNFLNQFDFFNNRTCAFGMRYDVPPAKYSTAELISFEGQQQLRKQDSLHTISILENWKARNVVTREGKPKFIIYCCSGGGLRSTLWTFYTMQYLDSISGGKLLPRTELIVGSSGGMLGAAYMRELWLREQNGEPYHHNDFSLRQNAGKDILNPIAFSIAVNDWFLPLRHVSIGGQSFSENRAYAFERKFIANTGDILDKRLCDYRDPENKALIPMMVFSPTIVNDGRKLLISPQGISYMVQSEIAQGVTNKRNPDAVEFCRFFAQQNADSVLFSSVLRMNATFPFITPLTDLPSDPTIEVFDAGMRDNFGVDNALRFVHMFRSWLSANTSGVILIESRDKSKVLPIEADNGSTIFQALTKPLGSFYGNLFSVQDFNNDRELDLATHWFPGPIDVLSFEMQIDYPDRVSLSWHLTNHEKNRVIGCMQLPDNQKAAHHFLDLLGDETTGGYQTAYGSMQLRAK